MAVSSTHGNRFHARLILPTCLQAEAEPWGLDPLDKTFWGMATAPGQMSQRELSRTLDESAHYIRRSGVCKFRIARTKFLKLLTC